MKKHAYLIMAHNQFEILKELIMALDDNRNDIFVHIDKKSVDFPIDRLNGCVRFSGLYVIPRMEVNWGGYSQIACELHLMDCAREHGDYEYYHLLTGVFYPLKSQDYMHEFFELHSGMEFVGFDNSRDYGWRAKYVHLFSEIGKPITKRQKLQLFVREKYLGLQSKLNIVKGCTKGIIFKKGIVYWSITQNAVDYILAKMDEIKKIYANSFCADELFVQTILYNSEFKGKIFDLKNDFSGSLRTAKPPQSWESNAVKNMVQNTRDNSLTVEDVDWLMNSGAFYAMKFIGDDGLNAISLIKELIEERKFE